MHFMDWLQILNEHVSWKERLLAYLDGTGQEKLDPAIIRRDDQDVLGKWIYGDGKYFNHMPHYIHVKTNHRYFHDCAAQIVELSDAGKREDAKKLLTGKYAKLSHQLKLQLINLYREVTK
jgi:Chemoreceptor zinc-binding domain